MRLNLHSPKDPAEVTVVANQTCTAQRKAAGFVRHLAFDVTGSRLVGAFQPGQAFGIIPPGHDAQGQPHRPRLFSVCSPSAGENGHGRVYATTVKRLIAERWEDHRLMLGTASNYLCDLQIGEKVQMIGPAGKRMLLPAEPAAWQYLFIATGTGIAPFRAMVLELLGRGIRQPMVLLAGAPYATDLLYHTTFLKLAEDHPPFRYVPTLSRQPQLDGHDPMYVHDRLKSDQDLLLELLGQPHTLIYLCGILGMELGVFRELATILSLPVLGQYLEVTPKALADVANWSRKTLRQAVRPTSRVFVEVY